MTTDIDPRTVTATIAKRVRNLRKRRRLTAQQLADRLNEHGIRWDRYAVTKLETGHRQNVSVAEWLTLAHVFLVPRDALLSEPACDTCDDTPDPGFTCNQCGTRATKDHP